MSWVIWLVRTLHIVIYSSLPVFISDPQNSVIYNCLVHIINNYFHKITPHKLLKRKVVKQQQEQQQQQNIMSFISWLWECDDSQMFLKLAILF